MKTENISPHITYREATFSVTAERKGIPNLPDDTTVTYMRAVAEKCFEPARAQFGPLKVTSFYRSPTLNKAIGGSATSDHCFGKAIDMQAVETTNAALFQWCRQYLDFDQLIWEFGTADEPAWVHISYRSTEGNRHQVIRAVRSGSSTKYEAL